MSVHEAPALYGGPRSTDPSYERGVPIISIQTNSISYFISSNIPINSPSHVPMLIYRPDASANLLLPMFSTLEPRNHLPLRNTRVFYLNLIS